MRIRDREMILMYRIAMQQLMKWKQRHGRKPLLIRGARQVGKTWIMKAFGNEAYQNTLYVNFENNTQMKALFAQDYSIERLVLGMELYGGQKIEPESTLILFDEVQEAPQALTSLKYFYENAPQYHIICAGSQLGIALHKETSFPVGKVEFLNLYPLSFHEFMLALDEERFAEIVLSLDYQMITTFKQKYIELLKLYYYIGGMPEAVQSYIDLHDFNVVRQKQQSILDAYEQDFSKHAPYAAVPRIRMLWNSIPVQLARDNKKFIYKLVQEGARAREYETAMLWLLDCGLIHKVHRVSKPGIPLKAYEDFKAFKLYFLDIGLLCCMVNLHQKVLLEGNVLFQEFKGALTEQYVLQQMKTQPELQVFYWTNDAGSAEVDFLLDNGQALYPLEVKAEVNLKARSLKVYRDLFHPHVAVRTSMADYRKEDWLVNIPLYTIGVLGQILRAN